ncbi:MAG: hypothetical protein QNK23_13065 [Crocinitomicaceae bacterium]|nr:hypothetical protein [Crocinitomicaceae bacterium]
MRSIILTLAIILTCSFLYAQYENVDQDEFVSETQHLDTDNSNMKMVWWIPIEFWKVIMSQEESLSDAQVVELVDALSPYVIFGVIHGEMSNYGAIRYTPQDEIKSSIRFVDANGMTQLPIPEENLNTETQILLNVFEPLLKNMIGEMGENFRFYVFKDINGRGVRVADPLAEGTLTLTMMGEDYKWETPLSSLLPPRKCPVDNAPMNGSWNYCPIHGDKLSK